MSIQTEMLPVVAVCQEAELMQRLIEEGNRALEREKWEHRYSALGLLTREQIQQANHPDWQWGDYSI